MNKPPESRREDLRPPREPLDEHAQVGEHNALGRISQVEAFRLPLGLAIRLATRAATLLWRAWGPSPALPAIVDRELAIPGLPSRLDGLRLAHISDVHCGPYFSLSHLRQLTDRIAEARPDLVLITGDLVHRDDRLLEALGPALAGLAPAGRVFAVRGNHDRQVDPLGDRFGAALTSAGIKILDNSARRATLPGRGSLWIAGIDDPWEGAPDLDAALAMVPRGRPYLLLSHSPDVAEWLGPTRHRPLLLLAGHTHGGQVVLPLLGPLILPSAYGRRYQGGVVYRPDLTVHVSRGAGVVEPPFRLGAPAEVPMLCLRETSS